MNALPGEVPPSERPVVLDCVAQIDGRSLVRFIFEDQSYEIAVPETSDVEFTDWLTGYAARTSRCACCDGVILPGQSITVGHILPEDSGISHLSTICNDNDAAYAGSFNADGEVIPPWPEPEE